MSYLVEFFTESGRFIDGAEFYADSREELEEEAEFYAEDLDANGWAVDYWMVQKLS